MVLLRAHPVKPCGWLGSCRNLISRGMVPTPRSIFCCKVRDVQSHTYKCDPYFPKNRHAWKERSNLILVKGFFLYGLLNPTVLKSKFAQFHYLIELNRQTNFAIFFPTFLSPLVHVLLLYFISNYTSLCRSKLPGLCPRKVIEMS